MSSDYEKGYRGEPSPNTLEYQRGQQDSYLASPRPPAESATFDTGSGQSGATDLGGVTAAGARFAAEWAIDPNGTLNGSLRVVLGFTIIGSVLGFLIGNWLGDTELWLAYTKFFFWFASFMMATMILGVTLGGRGTRRGTLSLLFLGGSVAFMIWAYVLSPGLMNMR